MVIGAGSWRGCPRTSENCLPSPLAFDQIETELLRSGRRKASLSQSKKDGAQVVTATCWSSPNAMRVVVPRWRSW